MEPFFVGGIASDKIVFCDAENFCMYFYCNEFPPGLSYV